MKKKPISQLIPAVLIAATLLSVIGSGIYIKAAELSSRKKVDGIAEAASGRCDFALPEGVRVVSLGEATHGNKEFQELKLQVFSRLAQTGNVKALVLEGDFGGCSLVNDYIQGGEGDPEELVNHLGYRIYRTEQMSELIRWMRSYNDTAADEDKVRIYGMDIQKDTDDKIYLSNFYSLVDEKKGADYTARMGNTPYL